jgi:hypothetical protein
MCFRICSCLVCFRCIARSGRLPCPYGCRLCLRHREYAKTPAIGTLRCIKLSLSLRDAVVRNASPGFRARNVFGDSLVLIYVRPDDTHLRKKFTVRVKSFLKWLFCARRKVTVSRSKLSSRSEFNSKKQLDTTFLKLRIPQESWQTTPGSKVGARAFP